MNNQLSFLPDLDRARDTRTANLCRSWNNAVLNDCGVFVDNRVDITVRKTAKKSYPNVTIHCALDYPKVYYSFDVIGNTALGGGYPGRDSHNFDVHEHAENVTLMMEHHLRDMVKSYEITEKMIGDCIKKFNDAITSDNKSNENAICNNCGYETLKSDIKGGLCAICYKRLNKGRV